MTVTLSDDGLSIVVTGTACQMADLYLDLIAMAHRARVNRRDCGCESDGVGTQHLDANRADAHP